MFTQKTTNDNSEQRLRAAFMAANEAAFAALGKNDTHNEYFDLAVLLAASAITGNGHLSQSESVHNAEIFVELLKVSIFQNQPTESAKSAQTARLM